LSRNRQKYLDRDYGGCGAYTQRFNKQTTETPYFSCAQVQERTDGGTEERSGRAEKESPSQALRQVVNRDRMFTW
jgi:hypothetical protein